ncbi:MAG TPA: alanine--tRNA ligase [Myxococcota bacterium]|nr:alanine--tRNA ligase [Myxococcota bacterium]
MALSADEIREAFLRFFEERGHRRVLSSSLVPQGDPTLLFTNAGMVQFKRVFLGEETRDYKTATTSQKCMRVSGKHNDLENVGRTPRHLTFFEMLGNFSFGDYFKREAIAWAWELVTRVYGLPAAKLGVTVFREDDEAARIWREEVGLPANRIVRLDEADNFWQMGDTGPCGPCSEIYFDTGEQPGSRPGFDPTDDSGRWLEIWNLVFMQFDRNAAGQMNPLPRPCVDTGAGLERMSAVLQGKTWVYDTDLFAPILLRAQELSGVARGRDPEKDVSLNVVADHARALTFLIGDGVLPSNEGRGYVLRRILRRAARHGVRLGIERPFLHQVSGAVIDAMSGAYPDLAERRAFIADRIEREEQRFLETLTRGLALLEDEIARQKQRGAKELPGEVGFRLYDTYGFPLDLTTDILRDQGMTLEQPGFDAAMEGQRARARAAWKGSGDERVGEVYGRLAADLHSVFRGYESLETRSTIRALLVDGESREVASTGEEAELVVDETPFYAESGGQVGDRGKVTTDTGKMTIRDTRKPVGGLVVHLGKVTEGEIHLDSQARLAVDAEARAATVRNHSGTHLLHAALRRVLGPQAMQKGSLVAPDRLRFDFTHDAPLDPEEIRAIEDHVNDWIERNAPAQIREMGYREAIESGAVAIFEEKYGDVVRVIRFGDFSTELCGGTHARATGDIGLLKIVGESGIAAGVRRIEALTGKGALLHLRQQEQLLRRLAELLRSPVGELPARVEKLLEERRAADQEIERLRREKRGAASVDLSAKAETIGSVRAVVTQVDGADPKELRNLVDELRAKLGSGLVLLAARADGRVTLAAGVTQDLATTFHAGQLIGAVSGVVGGKGGGRPDFAQGGGPDVAKVDAAFEKFRELVREKQGA